MGSFVHLHVHTEYSMLDGAAKVGLLMDEVSRQGMPAVAMSDHGNVHGAYDFYHSARGAGVKPIIGIESYVAPASRYHRQPVFYSDNLALRRSNDDTGEGGDVSGRGLYTHMTMWAADAQGLRNLFRLQSRAWLEGHAQKYPRMDDELLSEHGQGIIATTGCPSGEVQTRIRLGQYDEALKAAAKYQEIFGKDNYFLELMDHGIAIERRVRDELLSPGQEARAAAAGHQRLPLRHREPGAGARRAAVHRYGQAARRRRPVPVQRQRLLHQVGRADARAVGRRGPRRVRQHAADRRTRRRLRRGVRPPGPDAALPRTRGRERVQLAARGDSARRAAPLRRRSVPRRCWTGSTTSCRSSTPWASPATSWSSPTSAGTPARTASGWGPAAARPPGRWSPTARASPSSTRSSTS